jgi:glutaredoxin
MTRLMTRQVQALPATTKNDALKRTATSLLALALAALLLGTVQSASAQAVYRVVGPDGKVTFTDRMPTAPVASGAPAGAAQAAAAANSLGNPSLPFELQQVVSRYPVVLYTGSDCVPCGAGRALLASRGVVFSEKTVTTAEDAAALQRLSGTNSLPAISIGSQQISGFSDVEWAQYLDAAGYPKMSRLPRGYRQAAATPLVAATPALAEKAAPLPPPSAAVPATAGVAPDNGSNPAGIRF